MRLIIKTISVAIVGLFVVNAWALDPVSLEKQYASDAKQTASSSRGEKFFTSKQGKEWSCASCHGVPPTKEGKHASTDKSFKRNCNDVLGRECSSLEKADVMAYLNSLK